MILLRLAVLCLAATICATFFDVVSADDFSCSKVKPCPNGACCGASGFCGYGPTYCGKGCQSNCNATAECGKFAVVPGTKCPLNVCCSQYGFCGTTPEFCDTKQKCQSGCGQPKKPSGNGFSASQRVIGYFESWAGNRPCDQWDPTMISASQLTHLNFAFALIDGSNRITPSTQGDIELYKQVMTLKDSNAGLKIFISVGGWAFNDPGSSQKRFSTMASSASSRATFISSSLQFMRTYGFDGIDIDWEYPVDDLRGGQPDDKKNLNSLLKEFRTAIDGSGTRYGLTITTPSSYYYLRHFDVTEIAKWIDWFNHMTYDLHGVWDKESKFLGPIVNSHSNLTEIDISMDLFWRNNIPASKVAFGLGFYGRSFQLASKSCTKPGCTFKGPAKAGPCTGAAGVLSYSEIQAEVNGTSMQRPFASKANIVWDKTAAVKYASWDDQWVSYDDLDTFKQKIDYANKLGLGGMLIWAVDQDSGNYDAISALTGTVGVHNKKLAFRNNGERRVRDIDYLAGTCRLSGCAKKPECAVGFSAIATGKKSDKLSAQCKKGQSQLVCCPSDNMPESCRWAGDSPNCRSKGYCASGEDEIARDSYGDGNKMCTQGDKALCCKPKKIEQVDPLKQCQWFGTHPHCDDGFCSDPAYPVKVTYGYGGNGNGKSCSSNPKVFCCPAQNTYTNCAWTKCVHSGCPDDKVKITSDDQGDGGVCWLGARDYCCDKPVLPMPNTPKPPERNGHWGSLENEGCKSNGYRQWSSKLLDVDGSWENACATHPAFIKDHYFMKPTKCDKSVFGIWGKFWVPDEKCCDSSMRVVPPEHFGVTSSNLVPGGCGASSGRVNPVPINPIGGIIAMSVFELMRHPNVRSGLQHMWDLAFPAHNMARETAMFIFQLRNHPSELLIYIGTPNRFSAIDGLDQRVPGRYVEVILGAPGLEPGDVPWPLGTPNPPRIIDYVLIAMAHSHPFLDNLGRGLSQPPSRPDHQAAWRVGIPSLVVTRLGTFVAGPTRRVARSSANDVSLTNLLSTGNFMFEYNFAVVPQDQAPAYDEDQYHPLAGGAAFVPDRAQYQLDEPTNGRPLLPDDNQNPPNPNPHYEDEEAGPGPGPG